MTSSDYWQQVKILLEQAGDLPADQQYDYLTSACSNEAVRREVLELLRADAEPDGWSMVIPSEKSGDLQAESTANRTEHRIGRYTILRQIGAGGMGSVFLAQRQDEDVVQAVAVKLIQSALYSETALVLFRRERRILAALDHPGICPLIDSGMTDDGRPYLVMPYLEGAVPVTEYCEQHDLNDRSRARLFIDICQAVHHAHQNLVVHSDIKPANVMITPEGRVQLLDFGIARMLRPDQPDPTLVRAADQPVTLDYASPEQLRGGAATTQSDVYALGVLLHQLLAGDKPWQLDDTTDLLAQLNNRIRPPRQGRRGKLPEDAYNIVGKATAMEPARRYGSVQALAEDVDAWMTHRPVRARAPGWRYLATRFVQRHRWPVALMASLVVAAVALVSVMTLNAARIAEQAEQIAVERDRAQATARFWVSLFDQTDPVRALSPVSGLDELLDRATEQLESDDAISPNVRAQLLGVISTANWNLVRPDPARLAAELGTQLAESEEVSPIDRALAWKQLANIAYARTDVAGARLAIDRALAELEQADSPDPASRATILSAHALTLDREGRTAEAAEAMQRAVDLQQQVPMERIRVDHAIALSNLAWMHFSLARSGIDPDQHYTFAESALGRSLELTREHFGEAHPSLLNLYNAAGTIAMTRNRNQQALMHFDAAEAIARDNFPAGHEFLAYLFYNQGVLHWRLDNPETSSRAFAEALAATRQSQPDDASHLAGCLTGLARAYLAMSNHDAVMPLLDELATLRAQLADSEPWHLWHELLERQAQSNQAPELPTELNARIEASGDRDLILAQERLSSTNAP